MLETLLFVVGLNAVLFLYAFYRQSDKLTDFSYATSFLSIALYGVLTNETSVVKWIIFGLVAAWAFRLGTFLVIRINAMGHDRRFDDRRKSFLKFGQFWIGQGIAAWVIMLGASLLFFTEGDLETSTTMWVGVAVAAAGLLIETVADLQKFRFTQNKKNKGKWIEEGLWKYSRHPNYFGEIVVWYGVYLAVYTYLTDTEVIYAAISPLTISIILLFGTGVPILEKSADKRWGKDKKYQEYKRRTSLLIPLPRLKAKP